MTGSSSSSSKTVRLPLDVVKAIQNVIDVLAKIGVTKSTIKQLHDGLWQKNHYYAVLKRSQEYSKCFKNECNLFNCLYQAWIELHKYYQQKYTLIYKRLYKLRIQQQEQQEEETSSSNCSQYVICLMIEDTRRQQIVLAERITACLIHTMKLQQYRCNNNNNNNNNNKNHYNNNNNNINKNNKTTTKMVC